MEKNQYLHNSNLQKHDSEYIVMAASRIKAVLAQFQNEMSNS